jgi:hypothetical protein
MVLTMVCYSRVKFLNKNGYDYQRRNALRDGILKDFEYPISKIVIDDFYTTLYITVRGKEIPVNAVMFEGVKGSEI